MKRFFFDTNPSRPPLITTLLTLSIFLSACDQSIQLSSNEKISDKSITTAVITPNGIVLGTLENGAVAHINDTQQANYLWRLPNDSQQAVSAVAIAKKAPTAITSSGSTLTIWNTSTGKAAHYLSAPASINTIAITDDGSRAILGLDNRTATIINLQRGGIIQSLPHSSPVLAVAISNKGLVLTGEEMNKAHLWKIGMELPLFTQEHSDAVTLVRFAPNNKLVFSASRYDTMKGWDPLPPYSTSYELSSQSMALKAGRLAIDMAFIDTKNLLILFSDNTIEYRNLGEADTLKQWRVGKKTILAKENTRPVSIGKFNNDWKVIMSDGKLYSLGNI